MRASCWIVAGAMAVSGCEKPLVEWREPEGAAPDSLTGASLGGVMSLPADTARCESSARVAHGRDGWYAAWLRRRADSSVVVLAARSADSGHTWSHPGVVDSVDVARIGCVRPAPAIAISDGYVHVAYALDAPEGYGVFFAHSMDATASFHSPIPVVYGDRLAHVAVAADGVQVVVAYEDPSGTAHRVDLAVSRTQGHSFEPRVHGSPPQMSATEPIVALHGKEIALSFGATGGGSRTVRIGQIQ